MPGSQHILAIEISNPGAGARSLADGRLSGPSVAVGRLSDGAAPEPLGEEMLRSQTSDTGRSGGHDDDLLPAIDRLCNRLSIDRRTIDRVAVSVGPGGYTSVRIACATGKMIAFANGGTCVSVPTALGLLHGLPADERSRSISIALASKGETFHLQLASARGLVGAGRLVGIEVVNDLSRDGVRTMLADQHLSTAIRAAAIAKGISIIEPVFSALNVLSASAALPPIPPAELLPFYPREPEAVALWKTRKTP